MCYFVRTLVKTTSEFVLVYGNFPRVDDTAEYIKVHLRSLYLITNGFCYIVQPLRALVFYTAQSTLLSMKAVDMIRPSVAYKYYMDVTVEQKKATLVTGLKPKSFLTVQRETCDKEISDFTTNLARIVKVVALLTLISVTKTEYMDQNN